ncbi:hypothetical protein DICPUDRAFT_74887 [Dictyostelium purpureum]|uniref:Zinc/iron permease n=1 Tax=Dictyostelium purpureum TaxID=5786 RepID=F0Z912_DICPU|nr:uncharacterized protein DICPUDRAFT_74887 [Dictyostelium purpureum]EGC39580.1 hypothetical protein DICPUDRAFT_74887 [Dictyostelium purpureum]|eukprot:XP_003283915.1 hypothetical protein DICPUDRAFT_74887 [Dictyostelium purpureum]
MGSIFAYSLLAGLAPLISSSVPFFLFRNRNINANVFHILLCVSAGLLFAVATLELVPESIDLALRSLSDENNSNNSKNNNNNNNLATSQSFTNTHHLNKIMEIDFEENEYQIKKENQLYDQHDDHNDHKGEDGQDDEHDQDEHDHEDEEKKNKFKIPMYGLGFGFLILIVIESLFSGHEGGGHSHSHLPVSHGDDDHHHEYELLEKGNVNIKDQEDEEDSGKNKSSSDNSIDIESADGGKAGSGSKNRNVNNGGSNSPSNNNSNGIHISKSEGDIKGIGEANNSGSKSKLTITTFIALSIHSFVDGVVISSAFSSSQHVGARVALAIVIHKIPDGLVLSSIILSQKKFLSPIGGGNQRLFSNPLFYFLLISCMTPLGAFISSAIFGGLSISSGSFVLGFGAGTFLYITSSAILPEILSSQTVKKSTSLFAILLGYLLFIFLDSTFHGAH